MFVHAKIDVFISTRPMRAACPPAALSNPSTRATATVTRETVWRHCPGVQWRSSTVLPVTPTSGGSGLIGVDTVHHRLRIGSRQPPCTLSGPDPPRLG